MSTKNLNTPIDSEIIDAFKKACSARGLAMGIVVQGLMHFFVTNTNNLKISLIPPNGIEITMIDNTEDR